MGYFDRNPRTFRIISGILTAYLLSIAGMTFYRFGSSPTDENWFKDPPSRLYITASIPTITDSIRIGDMLVQINGRPTRDMSEFEHAMQSLEKGVSMTVDVQRLSTVEKHQYSLPPATRLKESLRELSPTAYVFGVITGGASDRAGMKAGDLIVRINGHTFANILQADSILQSEQIGKTIEYVVIRDNREIPLRVTLAAFGFPFGLLILVVCGLVYMGFGAFVALKRPQLIAARLIGIAFLGLGFALVTCLLGHGLGTGLLPMVRSFTFLTSLFFGFALLFHADQYFPKERQDLLQKPWIRGGAYILAVLAVIVALLFKELWVLIGIMALLVYAVAVKIATRKHVSREYKKVVRIIKWASITASLGTVLVLALLNLTGKMTPQTIGFAGIPLLFIPLAYIYTIGRYRLLDMNLRIRRNVQYSFASVAWVAFSIALLLWVLFQLPKVQVLLPNVQLTGGSIEIVDAPMQPEHRSIVEKGVLMLTAIGLTFLFRTIGRGGHAYLAKKFYRTKYDYRRAANELAEVMATKLNMNDLARGIAAKLAVLMHLKRTGVLFFRDQKACCCHEAFGFNNNEWDALCLSLPGNLAESIGRFKGEFNVDYLPPPVKENFRNNGFHFIIPIRSKDKLVGALLLGEKLSESPFQLEDFEFLSAAAHQASVSIENAFLYEELAEQDRMKHELEMARRIQLESLPQRTPMVTGLELAGVSIPAMEVGGDYYDYLNGAVDDLTVIVGDVSGKGTSAALYMSKVQGIMRSLHGFGLSPKELFIRVNGLLCNDLEKKSFVTAIGGFFDTAARRLVLARAGHLPLYIYRSGTQTVERVLPRGIGFGLTADDLFATELEEKTLHYDTGDVFLFVTDGVTEASRSTGEQFGEEGVATLLARVSQTSAQEILDSVIASVRDFARDERQHDDQTVVVVKAT